MRLPRKYRTDQKTGINKAQIFTTFLIGSTVVHVVKVIHNLDNALGTRVEANAV